MGLTSRLKRAARAALTVLADEDAPTPAASASCDGCRYWDLGAGQRAMEAQPAFFRATAHLEPWQMARQRKVEPNPEYLRVEREMHEAREAGDVERANELHDELLTLDPGEAVDATEDADEAVLQSSWQNLGACGKHHELRFGHDTCDAHEARQP